MQKIIAFFSTKIGIAAAVFVVVVGAWYVAFSGNGPEIRTFTVEAATFVQEVSVSGKVIPAQEVDLGFTQSGRIARVNVKVGDRVITGRVLAEIDSGDLYAQLLQKEAALETQKAKLASLMSGTRPEEVAVAEADVRSDEVALAQASTALENAITDAYIKTDDAVRNKVHQFVSNPRTSPQVNVTSSNTQAVVDFNAQVTVVEADLNAWAADIQSIGNANDLAPYVVRAQARLASAKKLLDLASAVLNSATPTAISQTTLDTYESDVATGRANVSTVTTALTTALTAQKNAASSLDSSQKTLALKKAGTVQADIDAQAAQVKSAEADVQNARAQLSKTVITAPFSGVITSVDAKPGKIVSPNTPEISINSSAAFQIESYVPEVNIALVKVGDTAVVTLDAYGSEVPFNAKVISIDPAETIKDGVSTYRTLLEFAESDSRIRSGMTANIMITTAQKEGAISIPQGLVVEKNGKKYVKILEGNDRVIEREVTTGSVSSLGNIEVLTGLSVGELVVLEAAE